MKRMRLSAVLALAAAVALLAPLGAQNAAKKPIALEDILSFRAIGATSLSTDGKWYSYRLSPLQGDSDVVIKSTSGTEEWKFPVGEAGGGGATFSADSTFAAVTTAPTRRDAQANTRARRPNQNSVELVNLANGQKTTIAKIRRFTFAGEAGGWIAMHRYGATPATGGGPAVAAPGGPPVPPPPGGGRGGGAARMPPRDTAPRGTDLILRDLKTGSELSIGNVSEFALQQERPLSRARRSMPPSRSATASRSATCRPARSRRSKRPPRSSSACPGPKTATRWSRSRARTIASTASVSSASLVTPASTPTGPRRSARRTIHPKTRRFPPSSASARTARRRGPKRAMRSSSASRN